MPTKIEWCDKTINPVAMICDPVSPGCHNCYARRFARRHMAMGTRGYNELTGGVQAVFVESELNKPMHWRRPRRIFVESMGDLWHDAVKAEWRMRIWEVVARSPQHTFIVLTKRPQRICGVLPRGLWLGVSAENQEYLDARWPEMRGIHVAKRIVSVEPMLGPVRLLEPGSLPDWVICGAETGPGKRAMEYIWAADLQRQCERLHIPFFFKKDSDGGHNLGEKVYEQWPD